MDRELASLISPEEDAGAVFFDAIMFDMELARIEGKEYYAEIRGALLRAVGALSAAEEDPEVRARSELIEKLIRTDLADKAGVCELENIRKELRGLMKHVPVSLLRYDRGPDAGLS